MSVGGVGSLFQSGISALSQAMGIGEQGASVDDLNTSNFFIPATAQGTVGSAIGVTGTSNALSILSTSGAEETMS